MRLSMVVVLFSVLIVGNKLAVAQSGTFPQFGFSAADGATSRHNVTKSAEGRVFVSAGEGSVSDDSAMNKLIQTAEAFQKAAESLEAVARLGPDEGEMGGLSSRAAELFKKAAEASKGAAEVASNNKKKVELLVQAAGNFRKAATLESANEKKTELWHCASETFREAAGYELDPDGKAALLSLAEETDAGGLRLALEEAERRAQTAIETAERIRKEAEEKQKESEKKIMDLEQQVRDARATLESAKRAQEAAEKSQQRFDALVKQDLDRFRSRRFVRGRKPSYPDSEVEYIDYYCGDMCEPADFQGRDFLTVWVLLRKVREDGFAFSKSGILWQARVYALFMLNHYHESIDGTVAPIAFTDSISDQLEEQAYGIICGFKGIRDDDPYNRIDHLSTILAMLWLRANGFALEGSYKLPAIKKLIKNALGESNSRRERARLRAAGTATGQQASKPQQSSISGGLGFATPSSGFGQFPY